MFGRKEIDSIHKKQQCKRDSTLWVSWSVFLLAIMLFIDSSWLAWLSLQKKSEAQNESIRSSVTPKMFRLHARKSKLEGAGNGSENMYTSEMEAGVERRERASFSTESTEAKKTKPGDDDTLSSRFCLSYEELGSLSFEYQPHVFACSAVLTFIGLLYLADRIFFIWDGAQPGLGQYVMFKAFSFMPFSFLMLAYMWQTRHLTLNREITWKDSDDPNEGSGATSSRSVSYASDSRRTHSITKTETFFEEPSSLEINPFSSVEHTQAADSEVSSGNVAPGLLTVTKKKLLLKSGGVFRDDSDADDTDDEGAFGENLDDHPKDDGTVKGRLTKGAPLTSNLELFLENSDDARLRSSSQSPAALAESSETRQQLLIDEDARPYVDTLLVARLYARYIALPIFLEEEFKARSDIAKLLDLSKPKTAKRVGSSMPEMWRRYEELGEEGKRLMKKYSAFERMLDNLAEQSAAAAALPTESSEFKRSKDKKVPLLSMIPTNLYVHQTLLDSMTASSSQQGSPQGIPAECKEITSITFGAPAAHLLGFGKGGLRALRGKLQKVESSKLQTPDAILKHLKNKCAHAIREKVVASQALGALVAAATRALSRCINFRQSQILRRWGVDRAGLLVHSVSLLSTTGFDPLFTQSLHPTAPTPPLYPSLWHQSLHCPFFSFVTMRSGMCVAGADEGMIDDFAAAYESLKVTLRLDQSERPPSVAAEESPTASMLIQKVDVEDTEELSWIGPVAVRVVTLASAGKASPDDIVVTLRITPPEASAWALSILEASFNPQAAAAAGGKPGDLKLVPVLFNLGVNEFQTVANASRKTAIQTDINRRGVRDLSFYYERCVSFQDDETLSPELPLLLAQLADLVELEVRERGKHVDLLVTACVVARLLGGARTTSCKSAKDRTSVFHTLEVARLARRCGLLGSIEVDGGGLLERRVQHVADTLRGITGVRLLNAELNCGVPKYAFNIIQMQALPPELRPPPETAQGGKS